MSYFGKLIMGPMVRVSTMPMRLLALRYGADLVYSDEIIDHSLVKAKRIVNENLKTVDFVQRNGKVVFRTCKEEEGKVVLQLGTCNSARALKTAKMVEHDVSAVDINMGCPKDFSVKYGMGAALMENPAKACEILTTLVQNLSIPVTCKIRILPTAEQTLKFVHSIVPSGIAAIAIHGRTRYEKSKNADHPAVVKFIADSIRIPVIANGGSNTIVVNSDMRKFRDETNCASVMVSRAAQINCSIFRTEGLLPVDNVIRDYLRLAIEYDTDTNAKYIITSMLRKMLTTPRGIELLECPTFESLCDMWGFGDDYRLTKESRQIFFQKLLLHHFPPETPKADDEDVHDMEVKFSLNSYKNERLPKLKLESWSRSQDVPSPMYKILKKGDSFRAIVTVNQQRYTSSCWETNKLFAEHAAAAVCLRLQNVM